MGTQKFTILNGELIRYYLFFRDNVVTRKFKFFNGKRYEGYLVTNPWLGKEKLS